MSRRSAAVPFRLLDLARQGEASTDQLQARVVSLQTAYEQFCQSCSPSLDPLPLLPVLVSAYRNLDAFTVGVATAFREADTAALWSGELSRLDYANEISGVPFGPTAWDPFNSLRLDPEAARRAGFRVCLSSSDDKSSYVIKGPDGHDYYLGTTDPRDDGWSTVWMEQGNTQNGDVDGKLRWASALSGMPDPFGTPASRDWYRQNFRVDAEGNPLVGQVPSFYSSTTTPLYPNPGDQSTYFDGKGRELKPNPAIRTTPSQREVTTGNLVSAADTVVASIDAYQKSGNLNQGYYAIRFQKNNIGGRRVIVTVYQQRGDRTEQVDVNNPEDMPRKRRPREDSAQPAPSAAN